VHDLPAAATRGRLLGIRAQDRPQFGTSPPCPRHVRAFQIDVPSTIECAGRPDGKRRLGSSSARKVGPLGWGPDAKREVREGQEVDPGRPPVRQRFVTDGGVTVRVVKPAVHSGRGQRSARAAITRAAAMARGDLD
jgi:hypothetical protein